jgi:hypothetical protein
MSGGHNAALCSALSHTADTTPTGPLLNSPAESGAPTCADITSASRSMDIALVSLGLIANLDLNVVEAQLPEALEHDKVKSLAGNTGQPSFRVDNHLDVHVGARRVQW